jgi:dUTP pyrophosphatase
VNKVNVKIKKLSHADGMSLPSYATAQSAGIDLMAAISEDVVINPSETKLIPTGIAMQLPSGYEAQVRPRSGLALKNGITVLNTPGTIDADYRGEVCVILINHSNKPFTVERGMRIAQMVIAQYASVDFIAVDDLEDSERSTAGFGSTGVKELAKA